jgi:uncharacterized protein YbaP (TraB family)
LFGTTHFLRPGFKWRSPALDRIVSQADELVVETYIAPGATQDEAALMSLTILSEPRPILERVPAERREALKSAIAKTGVPLEALSLVKTWVAAMMLGLSDLLEEWGVERPEDAPGVEDALEAEFRAAGKPILSVEEPKAGLEAFNSLTEEDQVKLLLETLEAARADTGAKTTEEDALAADDRLWVSGRYEEAYAATMKDFPPVLFEGLVRRRNQAWTSWLAERLKKPGTSLFAVGAAHLAGEASVQGMLEARGLKVERFD